MTDSAPSPDDDLLVGRRHEVGALKDAVRAVAGGRGQAVMIEGEPGIGKSALVMVAAAEAAALGCQVFHSSADELTTRFPLQVLADALGVRGLLNTPASTQTSFSGEAGQPASAAGAAHDAVSGRRSLRDELAAQPLNSDDPVYALAEQILARIDQLCVAAPTVLAIDDLQWADEASLGVLSRLVAATGQMPLLLMATSRTASLCPELAQLRRTVTGQRGRIFVLKHLSEAESMTLAGRLANATAGPGLRARVAAAGGNPLYVRETVDALVRGGTITISGGMADVSTGSIGRTVSLSGAIADRLGSLTRPTREVLRLASLLGHQVVVVDLAALAGRTAVELMPMLDEALSAGILTESGDRLVFRHGLIRDALHESMPLAVRSALHRQAAQALDTAGAPRDRVATHLMAATAADTFTVEWLVEHGNGLASQAPAVAQELLTRVLGGPLPAEAARTELEFALLNAAFRRHSYQLTETTATRLLNRELTPERAASVAWMLGYTHSYTGRYEEALAIVGAVTARVPCSWRGRLESLSALLLYMLERYSEAEDRAGEVLRANRENPDPVAAGYARHVLSLLAMLAQRTGHSNELIDEGLATIGDDPHQVDLRMLLMINRIYFAERMPDVEATLRAARTLSERHGGARSAHLAVAAATYFHQVGRWDDALSELDERNVITHEVADRKFLRLGLAALIAVRRGQVDEARTYLAEIPEMPASGFARNTFFYAHLARGAVAEQLGDLASTVAILASTVDPDDTALAAFRHVWVACVVRVAQAAGETDLARRAVDTAAADARAEPQGIRGVAARWCAAMVDGDLAALDACADFYREAGFIAQLGDVYGDAAVACAAAGDPAGARSRMAEAAKIHDILGTEFALRRTEARLRTLGVRRGRSTRTLRPSTGWDALTTSEARVAELVAEGRSNPDIAVILFLSRRTVETHVSRILAKLEVRSRIEVLQEVNRHRSLRP